MARKDLSVSSVKRDLLQEATLKFMRKVTLIRKCMSVMSAGLDSSNLTKGKITMKFVLVLSRPYMPISLLSKTKTNSNNNVDQIPPKMINYY